MVRGRGPSLSGFHQPLHVCRFHVVGLPPGARCALCCDKHALMEKYSVRNVVTDLEICSIADCLVWIVSSHKARWSCAWGPYMTDEAMRRIVLSISSVGSRHRVCNSPNGPRLPCTPRGRTLWSDLRRLRPKRRHTSRKTFATLVPEPFCSDGGYMYCTSQYRSALLYCFWSIPVTQ